MLETQSIVPVNEDWLDRARAAVEAKTKPPGSLGRVEWLAERYAGVQQSLTPNADPARLLLFAADHGIVAEGVSAWPSEVTAQMVANFLVGGAAANVFAKIHGVEIDIVDAGVASKLHDHPDLICVAPRPGTRNALHEDALLLPASSACSTSASNNASS